MSVDDSADNITRITCRHRRLAARLAEHHLRGLGLFGRWQRAAMIGGFCSRCGGERR